MCTQVGQDVLLYFSFPLSTYFDRIDLSYFIIFLHFNQMQNRFKSYS